MPLKHTLAKPIKFIVRLIIHVKRPSTYDTFKIFNNYIYIYIYILLALRATAEGSAYQGLKDKLAYW